MGTHVELKHRLAAGEADTYTSVLSAGSTQRSGPRIVARDRTAANDCLRDGLRQSRAHGGPYTYDEFFPDYDYSGGGCKCTPCKALLFFLIALGVTAGVLYQQEIWQKWTNNGGSGASDGTPLLYTRPPALSVVDMPTVPCDPAVCKLPNCHCSKVTEPPRELNFFNIPQIVMLTFDDAINSNNIQYFERLYDRTNPNGCPATGTFFVSHKYSNYRMVQEVYKRGHEIASHTISHSHRGDWTEIEEMRQILFQLAGIPANEVTGFRAPFLEPGGDSMLRVLGENGFTHDSSFALGGHSNPPMYPYTLDYPSELQCFIEVCPANTAVKGLWEIPLLFWENVNKTQDYGMADEYQPQDYNDVLEFLRHNFARHYAVNRAPFNIFIHASWFDRYPFAFDALTDFLDEIMSLNGVYMLSQGQTVAWMKSPRRLSQARDFAPWGCDEVPPGPEPCLEADENACTYEDPQNPASTVVLRTCKACPASFPWVGNPTGQA